MITERIEIESVPAEVREAALLVSNWMNQNGHEKWELLDVCSRQFEYELENLNAQLPS